MIAVGAPYAGGGGSAARSTCSTARPLGRPQTTLNQTTSVSGSADYDRLGPAVALSPDGTYLAAGASRLFVLAALTGQGGVYVWSYGGGALTTAGIGPLTASTPATRTGSAGRWRCRATA